MKEKSNTNIEKAPAIASLPKKELLRPDEVATYLSVSKEVIYNWCQTGFLESTKIRGTIRIFRTSVIEMINKGREI